MSEPELSQAQIATALRAEERYLMERLKMVRKLLEPMPKPGRPAKQTSPANQAQNDAIEQVSGTDTGPSPEPPKEGDTELSGEMLIPVGDCPKGGNHEWGTDVTDDDSFFCLKCGVDKPTPASETVSK